MKFFPAVSLSEMVDPINLDRVLITIYRLPDINNIGFLRVAVIHDSKMIYFAQHLIHVINFMTLRYRRF